jgi:hypothetical protein
VAALLVYFIATTAFTDTPRRLRALVRTITIFGFLLAVFGLTQSFTSDGSRVYWFRQLTQSTAFGPFINRHHFAGYMELALAIPLGLLLSGSLESYKRPLYAFAAVVMAGGHELSWWNYQPRSRDLFCGAGRQLRLVQKEKSDTGAARARRTGARGSRLWFGCDIDHGRGCH